MVAQRTLEQWTSSSPALVAVGLEGALLGVHEPGARYRLVETLGLVRAAIATRPLLTIASDPGEDERVRVAAVSALGQRRGDVAVAAAVDAFARHDGYLGDVARLAVVDLSARNDEPRTPSGDLTVAQLFLHADIDADLTQAGSGDNGGIATLLVRLGDALAGREEPTPTPAEEARSTNATPLASVVWSPCRVVRRRARSTACSTSRAPRPATPTVACRC
nr:hypothetical protein GCM10025699_69030 [Microbacterium flavescens]